MFVLPIVILFYLYLGYATSSLITSQFGILIGIISFFVSIFIYLYIIKVLLYVDEKINLLDSDELLKRKNQINTEKIIPFSLPVSFIVGMETNVIIGYLIFIILIAISNFVLNIFLA